MAEHPVQTSVKAPTHSKTVAGLDATFQTGGTGIEPMADT